MTVVRKLKTKQSIKKKPCSIEISLKREFDAAERKKAKERIFNVVHVVSMGLDLSKPCFCLTCQTGL